MNLYQFAVTVQRDREHARLHRAAAEEQRTGAARRQPPLPTPQQGELPKS